MLHSASGGSLLQKQYLGILQSCVDSVALTINFFTTGTSPHLAITPQPSEHKDPPDKALDPEFRRDGDRREDGSHARKEDPGQPASLNFIQVGEPPNQVGLADGVAAAYKKRAGDCARGVGNAGLTHPHHVTPWGLIPCR